MTKKSWQKLKYLENETSLWGEIKSIFHHFQGLAVIKNCLRPYTALLGRAINIYDTIISMGDFNIDIKKGSYIAYD